MKTKEGNLTLAGNGLKNIPKFLSQRFEDMVLNKNSSEICSHIQVVDDLKMRCSARTSLNRLCDIRDWEMGNVLTQIMRDLQEGCYIHRKSWEFAMCIYGLESLGVVTPNSRAISIGAGHERPLFYFANKIKKMVATDLYNDLGVDEDSNMLNNPEKFAPFPYNANNLDVFQMDGTNLTFEDNTFDFAFTLSAIEHFGSRDNVSKAMSELFRVLKPNGVLCLTTELILNESQHPEYFTFDELKKYIIDSTGFKLVGGDIDLRLSKSLLLSPINMSIEKNLQISPHIVLTNKEGVVWTSIVLFLKKGQ